MGKCWNDWCSADDCNGADHVDVNGRTWTERRGDVACATCRAYMEPHEHAEDLGCPMPGDAVRLAAPWKWGMLPAGKVGVINGLVGEYPPHGHASIIFRASTFRDDVSVSSSGGPGTIATDLSVLTRTADTVTLHAWKWQPGVMPGPNAGTHYKIVVPVWEWTPDN